MKSIFYLNNNSWLFTFLSILFGILCVISLTIGCGRIPPSQPPISTPADNSVASTSTTNVILPTSNVVSVRGLINPWGENTPISERQVVLCRVLGDADVMPSDCILMETCVETDVDGRFEISDVPPGRYYILYNSGRVDFHAALEQWGGETLDWADRQQQFELYGIKESDDGWVLLLMPGQYDVKNSLGLDYFQATLLLGASPFVVAHDIRTAVEDEVLDFVFVDVAEGQTSEVEFPVVVFPEGGFSGLEVRLSDE